MELSAKNWLSRTLDDRGLPTPASNRDFQRMRHRTGPETGSHQRKCGRTVLKRPMTQPSHLPLDEPCQIAAISTHNHYNINEWMTVTGFIVIQRDPKTKGRGPRHLPTRPHR